jgi:hypothetical protein
MGILAMAVGTIPLLAVLGILPTRPPAPGDAPAWIGAAIGLAFFLAGIVVIVRVFTGADDSSGELPAAAPRAMSVVTSFMGAMIAVLLAVILSWVAFGPGERSFSVSGGSGGAAVSMGVTHGGQIMGRIAFGFGALLAWILVGGTLVYKARRWFLRR